MGRLSGGKGEKPTQSLWETDESSESSLEMITSSAIELIDEDAAPKKSGAILIEHHDDPAEESFFKRKIDPEPFTASAISMSGVSSSSVSDAAIAAGVKSRHRLLPWLLFILSVSASVFAWLEVVEPRFTALAESEKKLAAAAKELSAAQESVGGLEKKLAGVEAERATLAAEQEKLNAAQQSSDEQRKAIEDLAERLRAAFANERRVEIEAQADAVVLRMTTDDVFIFGDVKLKDPLLLDQIGGIIKGQGDHRITIAAHTDSTPVPSKLRYRFPSNYELSAARAFAVLHQLEKLKLGDQIEIVAAGATQPIANNSTQPGRSRNRRIEILLR